MYPIEFSGYCHMPVGEHLGGGTQIYWCSHVWTKKKWKGVFFAVEHVKQGMCLGVYNAMFQGKGGGFVKICSNSLDSNLFRGSNLRQNLCLGGEFCIMTKMCLGVYFKTFVHACVHLQIWVPPPAVSTTCSDTQVVSVKPLVLFIDVEKCNNSTIQTKLLCFLFQDECPEC